MVSEVKRGAFFLVTAVVCKLEDELFVNTAYFHISE